MNKQEFLFLLEDLIIQYDRTNGSYAENEFEGLGFYEFACKKLEITNNIKDIVSSNPDIYGKYSKRLERGW